MAGNATVQRFLVTSHKMMDCPFGTVIPLAGHAEEAARTGPLATCRTRRRSSCRSRLLQVNWPNFGGSVVENKIGVMVEPGTTLPALQGSRACFPRLR